MSTGGEGGMVLTNDKELWRKVWSMKDHGKNPEKTREMAVGSGFRYLHDTFGTNARMTEMQAAIGRVQLRVLDAWVQKRRRHADEYRRRFAGSLALDLPAPGASTYHAYYKLHAIISPTHLKPGWDRDRLREAIISRGVPCFSGACPEIYLERCFQNAGLSPKEPLPQARQRGERSLMFLVHPTLSDTDVAAMIDAVGMAVEEASA